MYKVTRKSMKNSDIDLRRIENRLREIAEAININNKNNLTDINIICEEIFGQILNKLYDINLVSLSAEVSGNFIAVDLVDYGNRIAYQVTSKNVRSKIDRTLEKFNESGWYKDIDELYFLILSSNEHRYNGIDAICLKNGKTFSYTKNIMNFNNLIGEIERKNEIKNGFIVDVYDCINMVYDSGRLKYFSIVKKTELLMRTATYNLDEIKYWEKGYGDIHLSAFIPLSYKEIDNILGVEGLSRKGNKYLLMTIDIMEWEEILFFARNHDWFQEGNEIEWNIFNNNCSSSHLILSPNVNGTVQGDILAKLSVSPNELWNNKLDLYWEPGFKADVSCMDCFDNIVKWKADYTAEWIKNKLLERAHTYYEICKGKQPFWKRIWNRLLKGEELYLEQKM